MAKTTQVVTVASILAAIAITGFAVKMLGGAWAQGEKHAAQTAQCDDTEEDVAAIMPRITAAEASDVKQDIKINSLEIKQDAIFKAVDNTQGDVKDIKGDMKKILERLP